MALIRCAHCGHRTSSRALRCPECGKARRPGPMGWFAGFVLVGFVVAVALALFQALGERAPAGPDVLPPGVAVVDRWRVGLWGVGLAVALPPEMASEVGMEAVVVGLRGYTADRRFVEAHLFTDEAAARAHEAGRAGELGEAQPWFDAHRVGEYHRNERLDHEELRWWPEGDRSGEPRTLSW